MLDVPRTEVLDTLSPPSYAQCLALLEDAVGECLDHPGDETSRTLALGIARAVRDGCRVCGYREDSGILGTIASLLGRPPGTLRAMMAKP